MNQFHEAMICGDVMLVQSDQPMIDRILDRATIMVLAGAVDSNVSAAPLMFVRDGLDMIFFCARNSRIAAQLAINPATQLAIWPHDPVSTLGVEISGRCEVMRDTAARAKTKAMFVDRGLELGQVDEATLTCFRLRPTRLMLVDALATPRWAWQDFPRNIPTQSQQALEALGHWMQLWVRAVRAPFLSAAVVPVLLGGAIAYGALQHVGANFSWSLFLWSLLGAILASAGTNLINDYGDHESGADDANLVADNPFTGGSRAIQLGLVAPWKILLASLICFAATIAIGLHINALIAGDAFAMTPLLAVGVLGCILGITYTVGPLRLSYFGLGEAAVGLGFGPVMVLGSSYVLTASTGTAWPWLSSLLASIPVGIFIMLVLWINQFQDAPADAAAAKRNWVVRGAEQRDGSFDFVQPFALYQAFNISGCVMIFLLGLLGFWAPAVTTPWVWLALLPWRVFFVAAQRGRGWVAHWNDPEQDKKRLPFELLSVNAMTILLHISTGLLLTLAYFLAAT